MRQHYIKMCEPVFLTAAIAFTNNSRMPSYIYYIYANVHTQARSCEYNNRMKHDRFPHPAKYLVSRPLPQEGRGPGIHCLHMHESIPGYVG